MGSVITNRDRDCLACRLTSGLGLMGISGYLAKLAYKNPTKLGKTTIYTLAIGFCGVGVARVCDLPPFKH